MMIACNLISDILFYSYMSDDQCSPKMDTCYLQ
jgi:hypothetical protein